jgi:hypothetical protein
VSDGGELKDAMLRMRQRQEAAGVGEGAGSPVSVDAFRLIFSGLDLDIDEVRVAKGAVEENTRLAIEEGLDPAFVAGGMFLDGLGVGILIGEARAGRD